MQTSGERHTSYDEGARKFGLFMATIIVTIVLAGAYGILHDQLTYSISREYFTKFKFAQFGYVLTADRDERKTVIYIGFLATWWVGFIIGFVIGVMGFIYSRYENMRSAVVVGLVIVFASAIFFGFLGYFWGKFYLSQHGVDWLIPIDVTDRESFITVGSIHNFSYLGGVAGLLFAIVYMIRNKTLLVRESLRSK